MRAANTAGSAAATQPAGKPRLKRVMKAHLVQLWHTVAAAGPEGTTVEALTEQLPDASAKQLSTEVQRRAMQLATLLEPLLIVAMGLVVMLIVLAVLLPIIQLNQLVR